MGNGNKIKNMEKVSLYIQMVHIMKENIKMIKKMERALIKIKMGMLRKESGKREY